MQEVSDEFQKRFDRHLEEIKARGEVMCPYCGYVEDPSDDQLHVTYWGDDEARLVCCSDCEKEFKVLEIVTREFEVTKIEEHVEIEA